LQTAVATISGLPGNLVRQRWQATPPTNPPPHVTWCAVGVTGIESKDDYPYIHHDGTMQLPGTPGPGADILHREVTLKAIVTIYGPDPDVIAGMLRDGLYVQQNWEPLHVLGIRMHTVHDLSWTPEFINQQWIDRYDLELIMRQEMVRVYPVLNLDGADVLLHPPPVPDQPVTVREDTVPRP
jgi:hypothetical protein